MEYWSSSLTHCPVFYLQARKVACENVCDPTVDLNDLTSWPSHTNCEGSFRLSQLERFTNRCIFHCMLEMTKKRRSIQQGLNLKVSFSDKNEPYNYQFHHGSYLTSKILLSNKCFLCLGGRYLSINSGMDNWVELSHHCLVDLFIRESSHNLWKLKCFRISKLLIHSLSDNSVTDYKRFLDKQINIKGFHEYPRIRQFERGDP